MSNLKLAIVLGFALMFVAGLAVGRSPSAPVQQPRQGSWLSGELHLTPDQQLKMQAIWKNPFATIRPDLPKLFRDADKQRDMAILNLLSPEQLAMYDQIRKDHDARVASLQGEREQAMRDAEDRTRQFLTDDQKKKYDEILKAHGHRHGPPRNVHRRPPQSETSPGAPHADQLIG